MKIIKSATSILGHLFVVVFVLNIFITNAQTSRNYLAEALKKSPIANWQIGDLQHLETLKSELNNLPEREKLNIKNNADIALNYKWQTIPLTSYLDFVRNGNRTNMQAYYNKRKDYLRDLILGELVYKKGVYIDAIINGVWAILEQSTWALSAHLTMQKKGAGVPDVTEHIIDLGAGEIAVLIAYSHYFFKTDFEKISPLINSRIVKELNQRIITPYIERNDFWWQAFNKDTFVNNWNPWCNYNVLLSTFLIKESIDSKIVTQVIEKTMLSVDKFINYYKEDGACEEGPVYWSHAGGKMLEFLELVKTISKNKIYIGDKNVIKNIGLYLKNVHIDDNFYVNFADSSVKHLTNASLVYRYGKYINNNSLKQFAFYIIKNSKVKNTLITGALDNQIHTISLHSILTQFKPIILKKNKTHWFNQTEVCVARADQTNSGFFFAAKGGNNDESHNHNDIGTFILYDEGKPLVIDIGVETYTKKTFSKDRYSIWTMQSNYHNLPLINGFPQSHGKSYQSNQATFTKLKESIKFSLDLSKAYPKEADITSWRRGYNFNFNNHLVIEDHFNLNTIKDNTQLVFMLANKPKEIKKGKLLLKKSLNKRVYFTYNSNVFSYHIEDCILKDKKLLKAWNQDVLYRLVLTQKTKSKSGYFKYSFFKESL